jgi:hypothetical protein
MISITFYPETPYEANKLCQWFDYLSGLTPVKTEKHTFFFEYKEEGVMTKPHVIDVLHREMAFLEVENYLIS